MLKKKENLTTRQQELFELLASNHCCNDWVPLELKDRMAKINEFFDPVTTNEANNTAWEFHNDAIVRWIEALNTNEAIEWPELK